MTAVMTRTPTGLRFTLCEMLTKLEAAWNESQGSPDVRGRRYPLADLYRLIGPVSLEELADRTGVCSRSISRWHETGAIPESAADRVATALSLHVANVWPEWFDGDHR